jgi:hypothetical protein
VIARGVEAGGREAGVTDRADARSTRCGERERRRLSAPAAGARGRITKPPESPAAKPRPELGQERRRGSQGLRNRPAATPQLKAKRTRECAETGWRNGSRWDGGGGGKVDRGKGREWPSGGELAGGVGKSSARGLKGNSAGKARQGKAPRPCFVKRD